MGKVRSGVAGAVWTGVSRIDPDWIGKSVKAGTGADSLGELWQGQEWTDTAGGVRCCVERTGPVGSGQVRQGSLGEAGQRTARSGQAWHGR